MGYTKLSTYNDRPLSQFVVNLIEKNNISRRTAADRLGISTAHFNNKICRNSWKVNDLLELIDLCDRVVIIAKKESPSLYL